MYRTLVAIFSAGWIVPLLMAGQMYLAFLDRELVPHAAEGRIEVIKAADNTHVHYLGTDKLKLAPVPENQKVAPPPISCFPYLEFCRKAFTVACVWLALVILFWASKLAYFPTRLPASESETRFQQPRG